MPLLLVVSNFKKMKNVFCLLTLSLFLFACKQPATDQKAKSKTTEVTSTPSPTICSPKRGLALALNSNQIPPLFKGLGDLHYPVTTKSDLAQKYFNQGLALAYGFNHAEAARSFIAATKKDPECAMCHWGLAYVLGPNYNAGMEPEVVAVANKALEKARAIKNITEKEKDLIAVMSKRYPPKPIEDRSAYDEAYATALKPLAKKYPDDLEITGLYAEALMDQHPWDLWKKDGTPQAWTPEILQVLKDGLQKDPNHPALNHLYIHAVEASSTPEVGIPNADRLGGIMPGSGHLVHMPSHIYIRSGKYHKGSIANQRAISVDSTYVSACHAAGIYPLAYYPHNYHFLSACAALEGNSEIALDAALKMVAELDLDLMGEPGWGTLQHYYTIPWYIMVKFKMWDRILQEKTPDTVYKYPSAIWHYARGMAHADQGNLKEAMTALAILEEYEKDESIKEVTIWDINNCHDLIRIARMVLAGEIAQQKGDYEAAIKFLTKAIALEDAQNYNEPPDWFFSVRHYLGPVLLKAGKYAEAEKVYRKDLELFPETGYALFGLHKSLKAQQKDKAAEEILKRFKTAWQWADIELEI